MDYDLNLDLAVFTTKYILKDKNPIIYVVHDEDGEWQFLGEQNITQEDIMIVSLKNILDYDLSIQNILKLENGFEATRRCQNCDWIIHKS